jgi:hypothetical protein
MFAVCMMGISKQQMFGFVVIGGGRIDVHTNNTRRNKRNINYAVSGS